MLRYDYKGIVDLLKYVKWNCHTTARCQQSTANMELDRRAMDREALGVRQCVLSFVCGRLLSSLDCDY